MFHLAKVQKFFDMTIFAVEFSIKRREMAKNGNLLHDSFPILSENKGKIMEYVAIERTALNSVSDSINALSKAVDDIFIMEESRLQDAWVENSELASCLGVSLRTLQSYRERGVIGYSLMGRKIYYRRSEIEKLLKSGRIV